MSATIITAKDRLVLHSAKAQRWRRGGDVMIQLRRRPTRCAWLNRTSAKLHIFGYDCGKISSIMSVLPIQVLYSLVKITKLVSLDFDGTQKFIFNQNYAVDCTLLQLQPISQKL